MHTNTHDHVQYRRYHLKHDSTFNNNFCPACDLDHNGPCTDNDCTASVHVYINSSAELATFIDRATRDRTAHDVGHRNAGDAATAN